MLLRIVSAGSYCSVKKKVANRESVIGFVFSEPESTRVVCDRKDAEAGVMRSGGFLSAPLDGKVRITMTGLVGNLSFERY